MENEQKPITLNIDNTPEEPLKKNKTLEELLGEKLTTENIKEWFVEWVNKGSWTSPFEPYTSINKEEIDIDMFIASLDREEVDYHEIVMLKKAFDIKRRDIVWQWADKNNEKALIKEMVGETSIIRSKGIQHIIKYDSLEELNKHFYPNGRQEKKEELNLPQIKEESHK